jgi:acyl carrier protein
MTNQEKIALIEETLEIEGGTINENTVLSEIAEYDSMAKLTLIVLCDEEFSKKYASKVKPQKRKIEVEEEVELVFED